MQWYLLDKAYLDYLREFDSFVRGLVFCFDLVYI